MGQVRSLEAQGVPSKQAEAITSAIIEVLNDSLENVSESFVSKAEMQKVIVSITVSCCVYPLPEKLCPYLCLVSAD